MMLEFFTLQVLFQVSNAEMSSAKIKVSDKNVPTPC